MANFFRLCEYWRDSWTKAEDFSLGKLVHRIGKLVEMETELKEQLQMEASREETPTQLSAYNGLFKLMKKSSSKQLKRFVDKRVAQLTSVRSGISKRLRKYTMNMAATWSEKGDDAEELQGKEPGDALRPPCGQPRLWSLVPMAWRTRRGYHGTA